MTRLPPAVLVGTEDDEGSNKRGLLQGDDGLRYDYEDEYDDTYDLNQVGAEDADSADELTVRRCVSQQCWGASPTARFGTLPGGAS